MQIRHQLSPALGRLLPAEILALAPVETKATCGACAMAKPKTRRKHPYRADLKCCTFHPWLPNYAVGELLASSEDSSRHGREVVRRKIARREYALPIGVAPPVRYQVEFNARKPGDFGQREDWLCPYYVRETQACGLWRWRGSVCTGYYCKSDFGRDGLAFWSSLERYLGFVEMALMEECLVMLDFSPRQISDLIGFLNRFEGTSAETRSWVLPEARARALWNGYFDDIEGFYAKCAKIVGELGAPAFHEALGEHGEFLAVELVAAASKIR